MNLRLLTTPAILISIFSVACSLIGSGGRELRMTSSPDVPGAQGMIVLSRSRQVFPILTETEANERADVAL